jgi:hypothetical protein
MRAEGINPINEIKACDDCRAVAEHIAPVFCVGDTRTVVDAEIARRAEEDGDAHRLKRVLAEELGRSPKPYLSRREQVRSPPAAIMHGRNEKYSGGRAAMRCCWPRSVPRMRP